MINKQFKRKDEVYHCTQKGSRVKIAVERTAKGQLITVGSYNPQTGTWQNHEAIPDIIKKGVEYTFGKPDNS